MNFRVVVGGGCGRGGCWEGGEEGRKSGGEGGREVGGRAGREAGRQGGREGGRGERGGGGRREEVGAGGQAQRKRRWGQGGERKRRAKRKLRDRCGCRNDTKNSRAAQNKTRIHESNNEQ